MYLRKVLCVGTIWDLDDVAYPELDDYSAMSRWNFYQIVKHQLNSSRKEMKKTEKKLPMVRNLSPPLAVNSPLTSTHSLVLVSGASKGLTIWGS